MAFSLANQHADKERFRLHLVDLQRRVRDGSLFDPDNLDDLSLDGLHISRSTIARILTEADLKPHKSVYWLNSHDPDFSFKAQDICQLYLGACDGFKQGRLVLSSDEKTGMQALQRKYPTQQAIPGHPAKIEFEYIRHGTRCLLNTFCVPTGEVVWNLSPTRTTEDWVKHLRRVVAHYPNMQHYDWVVDNLNTHWSLQVCLLVADLGNLTVDVKQLETGKQRRAFLSDPRHKYVFHFTPIHGSWLNQVELFFSVLGRKFLKRGEFASMAEFEERIEKWLEQYNKTQAHPYKWTYSGEPLVRGTPSSQTRQQQQKGRAWFGCRPQLYEKVMVPLRSYKRKEKSTAEPQSTAATAA